MTIAHNWRAAVVGADATLHDVVKNLNETGLQIALITSADGGFVGTVTDGDIRRALLRGHQLGADIGPVVNRSATVVPPAVTADFALQLMNANQFEALPVVDQDRKLVGMHLRNSLLAPARRPNTMVIMAGGKGTRLRPYTENCPKPLLHVNGKPMLEHIIERAKAEGFYNFIIAVHYLGHMIEEYFGDGKRWEVNIGYLREQEPLGTAGAIGLLDPRPSDPFVVSNGDVLTDVHYSELLNFHAMHGAAATMAVRMHEWQHPFGVVFTKGVDITGFEEKPISRSHVNAGIYALEPSALDVLRPGEHCDMPTLFARLKDTAARTIVYPVHETWMDVGRVNDFQEAQTLSFER